MKIHKILFFILVLVVSFGCKKEDRILKKLVGTWSFTEFNRSGGYTKSDFSDSYTLQFFKHKNAYTATMEGIFRIDYADAAKKDIVDTFQFQLKRDVIDITLVQDTKDPIAYPVSPYRANITPSLLKRRFKIEGYKTSNIKLTRVDSTDLYIKATKQ